MDKELLRAHGAMVTLTRIRIKRAKGKVAKEAALEAHRDASDRYANALLLSEVINSTEPEVTL